MSVTTRFGELVGPVRPRIWIVALIDAVLVGGAFAAIAPASGILDMILWAVPTSTAVAVTVGGVTFVLAAKRQSFREAVALGLYCIGAAVLLSPYLVIGAQVGLTGSEAWTPVVGPALINPGLRPLFLPVVVICATALFISASYLERRDGHLGLTSG